MALLNPEEIFLLREKGESSENKLLNCETSGKRKYLAWISHFKAELALRSVLTSYSSVLLSIKLQFDPATMWELRNCSWAPSRTACTHGRGRTQTDQDKTDCCKLAHQ